MTNLIISGRNLLINVCTKDDDTNTRFMHFISELRPSLCLTDFPIEARNPCLT